MNQLEATYTGDHGQTQIVLLVVFPAVCLLVSVQLAAGVLDLLAGTVIQQTSPYNSRLIARFHWHFEHRKVISSISIKVVNKLC